MINLMGMPRGSKRRNLEIETPADIGAGSNLTDLNQSTPITTNAERFARIREDLKRLADEERALGDNQRLCAICDYSNPPVIHDFLSDLQNLEAETQPVILGKPKKRPPGVIRAPENGLWTLSGGLSVDLQERFRTLAAHAGLALGTRKDGDPEGVWLHELYSFLRETYPGFLTPKIVNRSSSLRNVDEIHCVCEASATFCSRLEKQALQQAFQTGQQSLAQNGERTATPVVPDIGVPSLSSWAEIEITFLSDNRVEICSGEKRDTQNFEELGFVDRRSRKPNRAWIMLRQMSGHGSLPRKKTIVGKERVLIEKRMQEIRKTLRHHLKIPGDPIPFHDGEYRAAFRLKRSPSFDT
jgi:hypothetical protein